MLKGFPQKITTKKLGRGHYIINRADGYAIEVRASSFGDWYQTSNMARRETLRSFKYDMANGYMNKDRNDKHDKKMC